MTRSERDAAYLAEVHTTWRTAFPASRGDSMPELYATAARRATADDWTELRPLLLALQTMLRINSTVVGHIGYSLQQSTAPTADAATAAELLEVSRLLREALDPLADALAATGSRLAPPGAPDTRPPRQPVQASPPVHPGLRGLLDIAAIAGVGTIVGVGVGIGSAMQAARWWWRSPIHAAPTHPGPNQP